MRQISACKRSTQPVTDIGSVTFVGTVSSVLRLIVMTILTKSLRPLQTVFPSAVSSCPGAGHRNWSRHQKALRSKLQPKPLRSEEHTSELQSHLNLVCRLLLE